MPSFFVACIESINIINLSFLQRYNRSWPQPADGFQYYITQNTWPDLGEGARAQASHQLNPGRDETARRPKLRMRSC